MKYSIWITGASGKIGSRLAKILKADTDNRVVATDTDVDITDINEVISAADIYKPDVIINCASISDAKYCEDNMIEAFRVNALGARNLAMASRKHNCKIIHLSTDDVFEGKKCDRQTEFDDTQPISVYGKSKLAGEGFVRELNPKHLIVRSSWVYGIGKCDYFSYVKSMGESGEKFNAPTNKISTPTSADTLAEFICSLVDKSEYGIFHASCEGSCNRYEFAVAILESLGYDKSLAVADDSEEASVTLLENLMLKMTGIYEMPDWKTDFEQYVKSIKG